MPTVTTPLVSERASRWRLKRPPASSAPPSPMRERANHVSESRVPPTATVAAPNPKRPWLRESSVASTANAGTGPGR